MSITVAFVLVAALPATKPLNCLDRKSWKDALPETLCAHVVDELKARLGEYSVINCFGPLQDGYDIGRCEQVDVGVQIRLRDEALARFAPRIAAAPTYFAGKDETCLDDAHNPKPMGIVRMKIPYITEVTQRMSGGSEAHCIVPGQMDAVSYTASPVRCRIFAARMGQKVSFGVVGDHVCEIK